MIPNRLGETWERRAENHLRQHGLRTIARNFHCRLGEIDLVMRHGDCTVFVEVRYRRDSRHGSGLESITHRKRLKIIRAAGIFLSRRPALADGTCRFDVVSIEDDRGIPRLRWVRDAFDAD